MKAMHSKRGNLSGQAHLQAAVLTEHPRASEHAEETQSPANSQLRGARSSIDTQGVTFSLVLRGLPQPHAK